MSDVIIKSSKFQSVATVGSVILIVAAIVLGYFIWKDISEENQKLRSEVVQFKELTETLVRSSTNWATKEDLENRLKSLLTKEDFDALEGDLDSLDSKLKAVGKTVGSIRRKVSDLEKSDEEGPVNSNVETCDDGRLIDVYEYTKNPQIKEIKDIQEAPVAKVEFDASQEKPWKYEVYDREYNLVTVVGKRDSGQLTFHHKLEYSVPGIDPDTFYNINIFSSDFIQVPLKNKMFWFNPILDLNFFVGGRVYKFANGPGNPKDIFSVGADVGISLSSYGETEADSLFRFLRIGVGYDAERRAAHFSLAPFLYNIGKPLPLLTNLYLAPQVGIDSSGGITVGLGIGPHF